MPDEFWSSILTEKSWKILQELAKEHKFILIGGWAVWLLTHQQKSKDIDIVVGLDELQKFKSQNLGKNEKLKKYEIKKEEIDIDIYLEHYSKLAIPAEDINSYTIKTQGFEVASPELLLILKQSAYNDRKDSVKGEKDKIDIVSLTFFSDVNFKKYYKILKKYKLECFFNEIVKLIKGFKDYGILGLNPREFKIKKEILLNELKES
jgi:hypothetical protein